MSEILKVYAKDMQVFVVSYIHEIRKLVYLQYTLYVTHKSEI